LIERVSTSPGAITPGGRRMGGVVQSLEETAGTAHRALAVPDFRLAVRIMAGVLFGELAHFFCLGRNASVIYFG
jgi:hypothetical protein